MSYRTYEDLVTNWRSTNEKCVCGHERLGHTRNPKDYDRYDCAICLCPKFEAVMMGRDYRAYGPRPPKPVPIEIRYQESTTEEAEAPTWRRTSRVVAEDGSFTETFIAIVPGLAKDQWLRHTKTLHYYAGEPALETLDIEELPMMPDGPFMGPVS